MDVLSFLEIKTKKSSTSSQLKYILSELYLSILLEGLPNQRCGGGCRELSLTLYLFDSNKDTVSPHTSHS